jgi:predicted RNA binding protein YcfA (HicA-like mRNA interferase family)
MTRLPRLKGKEVIRILEKHGFRVLRTKGSHNFLRHSDGRVTTVPVHSGEIGPAFCAQSFAILRWRWKSFSKRPDSQ